jgi:hypothetical protein
MADESTPSGIQSGDAPPAAMDTSSSWPTTSNVTKYSVEIINGLEAVRADTVDGQGNVQGTSYVYPGDPSYEKLYTTATGHAPTQGALDFFGLSKPVVYGVAAMVVLGVGYLLFRKK